MKKDVTTRLASGAQMPIIGFGTWQAPDGDIAYNAVAQALRAGYRHIDTASIYRNETAVGSAIRDSGIAREKIFVTTKLWNRARGYETTLAAFDKSLGKLGLDYVDLYLVHWPASPKDYENYNEVNLDTWRAMIDIYRSGRARAIGVSNFLPHHLDVLMKTEVPPMANQIELHPGFYDPELLKYCKENQMAVLAWSPLGSGRVLSDDRLRRVAEGYGVSVAQLSIRWCLQHGAFPLPKSVTPSRIRENLDVFDFAISDEDMEYIDSLERFGESGYHPDEVDF